MGIVGRTSALLFGITAFLLLNPSVGLACTCELPYPGRTLRQEVSEARKKAEAVFTGEVVEITENPQALHVMVKFKVRKSWGPMGADEVTVFTGRGRGDCGYRFEVGESYLVYAYKYNETRLGTNICQRTMKLADAAEDLKVLGKGELPEADVSSAKSSVSSVKSPRCPMSKVSRSSEGRRQ